ncbi:MAG: T9SS type A sorting domain-containing protein, partial [Bacteroidetes bacterium]|nr:T9SS type A sorting domain-containing protein [Bacteroidota bacterium]
SDLFISEYVEGSGNNKALEIYNPTSQDIDLALYMIIRYSNGETSASSANAIQLEGMIAPNDVHVGVIEKLNPSGSGNEVPVATILQSSADAFYCPVYNISDAWYFNGNDAIVLAKGSPNDILNSVTVDVFGKIGEGAISLDGGWTNIASTGFISTGYSWTEDHTLIRKSTVLSGDTEALDLFNVGLEWDSLAEDSWNNLGSHICDCASSTAITENNEVSYVMYPNPANQGNIVSINTNTNIERIDVVNILGEKVLTQESNKINTSNLARGTYLINIRFTDGRTVDNKLVIE